MNIPGLPKPAVGVLTFLIVGALAAPVAAAAGNLSSGRQMAMTVCASCHQVMGERMGRGPPSFMDIANMPSTTALSLRVFLRSNHREMPNLIISDADTDGLIAYILSLKKPVPEHR